MSCPYSSLLGYGPIVVCCFTCRRYLISQLYESTRDDGEYLLLSTCIGTRYIGDGVLAYASIEVAPMQQR